MRLARLSNPQGFHCGINSRSFVIRIIEFSISFHSTSASRQCVANADFKSSNQMSISVVAASVAYFVLVSAFWMLKEHRGFPNDRVLRFCCSNSSTCSDDFIRKNFNGSSLTDAMENINIVNETFIYLVETTTCATEQVDNFLPDEQWPKAPKARKEIKMLSLVSSFRQKEIIVQSPCVSSTES